jgi:flagellar biosynthesis/type III secretory pathway M-ring protein FliF/YscJ
MFNIGILELGSWFVVFAVLVALLLKLENERKQKKDKKYQEVENKLAMLQELCEKQHVRCLKTLDQLVETCKQNSFVDDDDISPEMQEMISEMFKERIAGTVDMVMEFRNQLVADIIEVRKMTDFNEVSSYMREVDKRLSQLVDKIN